MNKRGFFAIPKESDSSRKYIESYTIRRHWLPNYFLRANYHLVTGPVNARGVSGENICMAAKILLL